MMSPVRIRALVPEAADLDVDVYLLPNLGAVNVVIHGLLGEGVAASTRIDPQAKGLGRVAAGAARRDRGRSLLTEQGRETSEQRREGRSSKARGRGTRARTARRDLRPRSARWPPSSRGARSCHTWTSGRRRGGAARAAPRGCRARTARRLVPRVRRWSGRRPPRLDRGEGGLLLRGCVERADGRAVHRRDRPAAPGRARYPGAGRPLGAADAGRRAHRRAWRSPSPMSAPTWRRSGRPRDGTTTGSWSTGPRPSSPAACAPTSSPPPCGPVVPAPEA